MFFISVSIGDEELSWHVWAYTIMFGMLAPFGLTSKTEKHVFIAIVTYLICDYTAFYVLEWDIMCAMCSVFTLIGVCILTIGLTNIKKLNIKKLWKR